MRFIYKVLIKLLGLDRWITQVAKESGHIECIALKSNPLFNYIYSYWFKLKLTSLLFMYGEFEDI